MSPPMFCISARTGVIPIPPAIRSDLSSVRLSSVKTPNGPSANTLVPTGISPNFALWSPRSLTVIRNDFPSGASEIENGCCVYQNPFVKNRQKKNWPAFVPSLSSLRPVIRSEITPGASWITSATFMS